VKHDDDDVGDKMTMQAKDAGYCY